MSGRATAEAAARAGGPMIRGSITRSARTWIEREYGSELVHRAYARMPRGDADALSGQLLAASLYPLESWNCLMRAVAAEVKATRGESEDVFFRRLVRGSVSSVAQTVFKFLLGVFQPPTVLQRLPTIFRRVYDSATLTVVENVPGRFVAEVRGVHDAVREDVRMALRHTVVLIAEMARARNPNAIYTRDEAVVGGFLIEVTLTYQS